MLVNCAGFPTGEAPHLIFANREDIRDIELMTSKYRPVIEDTRSAIALDFDFVDKMVYWSDVAEEAIYRYLSFGNHWKCLFMRQQIVVCRTVVLHGFIVISVMVVWHVWTLYSVTIPMYNNDHTRETATK